MTYANAIVLDWVIVRKDLIFFFKIFIFKKPVRNDLMIYVDHDVEHTLL